MPARAALVALLLAVAWQAAFAGEARKFAALSLIGDRMLIVSHDMETGTRLDRNRREFIAMPERVLDNAVLGSVERAIKRSNAGSEVVLLGGNRTLYVAQGDALEDPDVRPVVDMVKPAVEKAGVTHLILVTKLRHDAQLRFADGNVGSGKLEGLGFYMDHALRTRTGEGERGLGFLAPFAYFRVSLVDVARAEVLAHRDVVASLAVSAARSPSLQAWESLSGEQKARLINALTQREASQAVETLLQER